jgi:hypothetical protein
MAVRSKVEGSGGVGVRLVTGSRDVLLDQRLPIGVPGTHPEVHGLAAVTRLMHPRKRRDHLVEPSGHRRSYGARDAHQGFLRHFGRRASALQGE